MEARPLTRDYPRAMTLQHFALYHRQTIGEDRNPSTRYEYQRASAPLHRPQLAEENDLEVT